jgi:hypothetical protein
MARFSGLDSEESVCPVNDVPPGDTIKISFPNDCAGNLPPAESVAD